MHHLVGSDCGSNSLLTQPCLPRQSPPPPPLSPPPVAAPAPGATSGASSASGVDIIGMNNLNSVNDLLYVFGNGNSTQAALNKCAPPSSPELAS